MFRANATDSSNQVSEIRSSFVKKYIKDRANAPVNITKSELEQYLEEPQFPFLKQKMSYLLIFSIGGNIISQSF